MGERLIFLDAAYVARISPAILPNYLSQWPGDDSMCELLRELAVEKN
jgi:hypothetical protein